MPFNWLIETYKWYFLTNRTQFITYYKSLQSILLGVLFSIFSPNRIGELGGRLVFIKKEHLLSVFYSNLMCSVSQLFVTIIVGLSAFFFFNNDLLDYLPIDSILIKFIAVVFILLSLITFFYSNLLMRILLFFSKTVQLVSKQDLQIFSTKTRLQTIGLSMLRYFVFTYQFYLAFSIFDINLTWYIIFAGIALVFFITALIPTAWISDLPVRGSVAYLVFDQLGGYGMEALVSSLILWLINLFFPAIMGLLVLPKVNWLKIKKLKF